jgi:minor histocompatibility antigen H13
VSGYNFGFTHLIVMIITAAIAGLYGYTKHWVLSNIYGESFSIAAIQLLNLDSFATGMLLLAGLFFYDIFWVFGTDVMVTVAKGLDVPIKVIFPKDFVSLAMDGIYLSTFLSSHFTHL